LKEYKIIFPEYKKEVFALPGTSLFECVTRAGILIKNPCAGAGTCGKCVIKIVKGDIPPSEECLKRFSKKELTDGLRLACRTSIQNDLTITIPSSSLFESGVITLEDGESQNSDIDKSEPFIEKQDLRISQPTLEEPVSDLTNLQNALPGIQINKELHSIREISETLWSNNFSCTAVIAENKRLLTLETASENSANFAIAIDLGTTTIAIAMLDLSTGKQVASAGALNPQVRFGDDILNRICAQSESAENMKLMSKCVIDTCNTLIDSILKKHNIENDDIYAVTIAGNTVMQHILCRIPAKQLGEIPFAPIFDETLYLTPKDLPFKINKNAVIVIFPVIGGFVGGDITAGLIASKFADNTQAKSLFVDVGTNGEIVLKNGEKMYATAAAAGPAFEGAGIESGMRAADGAIEKIIIKEGDLLFNVIGNSQPVGICGTALIDLVAEMLQHNLIDETGRILPVSESTNKAPKLQKRVITDKETEATDFLISSENGHQIFLSQKDVRQLQLASGAIRAAINVLLKKADMTADDLDTIYIAGGFGNYIRRSHAKRIGMIPNIPDNKIHFIGNTSLIGAKFALLDKNQLNQAAKLAKKVECVDVSLDMDFQMEFASAMLFPDFT
jgi:uncharacterized 2Fe-2S/4Fe-4S cluster protein (DUF4445 family)